MGVSDRDPLFFPPAKYGNAEEPETQPLEVDTKAQEKGLRVMLLVGMVLAVVVLLALRSCPVGSQTGTPVRPAAQAGTTP
jgi:hypothetical protein